jgi:hypothetical protein
MNHGKLTTIGPAVPPPSSDLAQLREPDAMFKVELDERSFLFPAAKIVSGMQFMVYRGEKLRLDLTFPFNVSQTPVEFLELRPAAVPEFTKKVVDAVYRTSSFLYISDRQNLAFSTHANGFVLQVGDFASHRELFISLACIWRICGGFSRASDFLSTPSAH